MDSVIEEKLRELDKSMYNLNLQLDKYDKNSREYYFYLSELARQFYACKKLMELEKKEYRINNAHFFIYADIDAIKELLVSKGYYEEENHFTR